MFGKKKNKKKLTQNQIITRISAILLSISIIVMLIIVLPREIKEIKNNTLGQVEALKDLSEYCDIDMVTTGIVAETDKSNLQSKLQIADVNIFKNNSINRNMFMSLTHSDNFSLSPNELAYFVNEILGITDNPYLLNFYKIEIAVSDAVYINCVADSNFKALTAMSEEQTKLYTTLKYNIPNKVFISTYTSVGEETKSSVVFNALDSKKNSRAKTFVTGSNTNLDVDNVLYNAVLSAVGEFCDKTNTTYTFSNNQINFIQK